MESKMIARNWYLNLVLAITAALLPTGSTHASTLEEIVVSGSIEETPAHLPFSFSLISGDDIRMAETPYLEQITERTPALSISRNSLATKIYMRGIGSQGNAGLDQSVSFYIDGVYHPRSRDTKLALVDVSRIEILKGPQSTYLGLNANAGTIAVQTNKARPGKTESSVKLSGGTGSYARFTGIHNYSPNDLFALRLVGDYASSDGVWDIVDPQTGNKVDDGGAMTRHAIRLSGTWLPTDNLEIMFKVEDQKSDRDNAFAWQPTGCDNLYGLGLADQQALNSFWQATAATDPNPLRVPFTCRAGFSDNRLDNDSPVAPYNGVDQSGSESVLQINWNIGTARLRSTTAYYDNEFGFEGNDVTHGATFHRALWVSDRNSQLSQELRLDLPLSQSVGWMIGLYSHQANVRFNTGDADARGRAPQFIATSVKQEDQTRSIVSAIHWNLTEKLDIEAGIRHIRTKKEFSGDDLRYRANQQAMTQRGTFNTQVAGDNSGNPDAYTDYSAEVRANFADEDETFSETLPSLTLGYQFSDNIQTYLKWQKGYKSGGFNFRLNGLDSSTLTFDPETVNATEFGINARFLENNLNIRAAWFDATYKDLQHNSNRGDDGTISAAVIRNASKANNSGLEVEVDWQVSNAIEVSASATWLDAEFEDYAGADCTRFQSVISRTSIAANFGAQFSGGRCSQDLSGGQMPHAPDFSASMQLAYQVPIFDKFQLRSALHGYYSDSFFTSPHADPLRQQDAFHKISLSLGIHPTNRIWSFTITANNLTDELTSRQLGQDQNAAVSGLVDSPRMVYAQFTYRR